MATQIPTLSDMEYRPLPTGTNAIRLIKLMSRSRPRPTGMSSDLLVCELMPTSRGLCPQYTAVSYTWGTSPPSSLLAIGEQVYQVSSTIEQVLRQLQAENSDIFVWIDQVCINQQDDAEKNDQVQQMRDIYSEAALVLAWLGPTADGSDLLLKHIESIGEAIWADDQYTILAAHSSTESLQQIGRAFRSLCERAYWKRLWIIQEFAVGRNLRIACGDVMVWDWNLQGLLVHMNLLLSNSHQDKKIEAMSHRIARTYLTPAASFMEGVVARRCRYWTSQDRNDDILFRVLVSTLVLEHDYNQPLATDPRDRLFSILHLARDANEFVNIVDYSRSCEDIYREAALAILKQGHIDLLSYCQFPKQSPNIPTWTPDWRGQIRSPCVGSPWLTSFHASANLASEQHVTSPDQHTIILKTAIVDTIMECGSVWDPDWLSPLDPGQTARYLEEVQRLCARSPRHLASDDADIVATYTCVAAPYNNEGGEKKRKAFVQAWRDVVDGLKDSNLANDTEDGISSHWYQRKLHLLHSRLPFLSGSGRIGLAPSNAMYGDLICIFSGGKVPYIIRPSLDGPGTFSLVGEAYVYGIMYGEFGGDTTMVEPIQLK